MGYRETMLRKDKPQLVIDGDTFDVDMFGMDDGRNPSPTDAFRFIFQLGSGYMIYLYVIQAGGRGDPAHFFHTFWLKDCAVAHVEMEDRGPPKHVRLARSSLPLNYREVRLTGATNGAARSYGIVEQHFTAESADQLTMEFLLDGGARLTWTRAGHWAFAEHGEPQPLPPDQWLEFSPAGED